MMCRWSYLCIRAQSHSCHALMCCAVFAGLLRLAERGAAVRGVPVRQVRALRYRRSQGIGANHARADGPWSIAFLLAVAVGHAVAAEV